MKNIVYALLLCVVCSCRPSAVPPAPAGKLSIVPRIDQNDSLNRKIIATLEKFQATKDSSLVKNEYWDESDFKTHITHTWILFFGRRTSPLPYWKSSIPIPGKS